MKYQLLAENDVQKAFADYLRKCREQAKMSRDSLAERSTVPSATIKKFELTGQISFRQLLLLWQTLDDLKRFYALTQDKVKDHTIPQSIEEVLKNGL
jgi:transcriptional regulator with XRE-family HTH domain